MEADPKPYDGPEPKLMACIYCFDLMPKEGPTDKTETTYWRAFTRLVVDKFPQTVKFWIVTQWISKTPVPSVDFAIRIVDGDAEVLVEMPPVPFGIEDTSKSFSLRLGITMPLVRSEVFEVQFLLNGQSYDSMPLPVVLEATS